MKVKLLRKIRKRFSITHYPDGCYLGDNWISIPVTILWDNNNNSYRYKLEYKSKEESYMILYDILREWIEQDYRTSRKRKNVRVETIWHK